MENSIPLQVIQNGEFKILKYIRDVCDSNGLRYYLAYGTLIGAVRHQGFIPWDDDVDVHMPREDYLKLVKIVQDHPHPYYRLISTETTPDYTLYMPKVIDSRTKLTQIASFREKVPLGIYADIFILDGAGNTKEEAKKRYQKAYSIFQQWRRAVKKPFNPGKSKQKTLLLWIKHTPQRLLGVRYWIERRDAISRQKAFDDCVYVAALGAGTRSPDRNIWKRECFGEGTTVLFNGENFRAPDNWDAVLRPEYGDYLKYPQPEKQHPHHRYALEIPDEVLAEFSSSLSTSEP